MKTNEEIMTIFDQLKEENHLSISEIARRVGMSKSAVSKYFNRTRSFPLSRIYDFAAALNVQAEDILATKNNKFTPNEIVDLPLISSVNKEALTISETTATLTRPIPAVDLPDGKHFYFMQKDNSMAPLIPLNAYVLVKFQEAVEDEDWAALIIDNDPNIFIRKVRKQEKFILLQAENPDFDPLIVTRERKLKIIGKAERVTYDL